MRKKRSAEKPRNGLESFSKKKREKGNVFLLGATNPDRGCGFLVATRGDISTSVAKLKAKRRFFLQEARGEERQKKRKQKKKNKRCKLVIDPADTGYFFSLSSFSALASYFSLLVYRNIFFYVSMMYSHVM